MAEMLGNKQARTWGHIDGYRMPPRGGIARWPSDRCARFVKRVRDELDDQRWEVRHCFGSEAVALGYVLETGEFRPFYVGGTGAFEGDALLQRIKVASPKYQARILRELREQDDAHDRESDQFAHDYAVDAAADISAYGARGKTHFAQGAR